MSTEKKEGFTIPIFSNGAKNNGLYGYTDTARVTTPAVTVSARGTIGFSAIRTEPFFPIVRLITLIPDTSKITLSYLYYALQKINFGNTGVSIPQLTVPDIKKHHIYLPPLPEQQKIANFLDNAFNNVALLADNATTRLNTVKHLKTALLAKVFHETPLTAPPHSTPDKESIPKDHTPKESTA